MKYSIRPYIYTFDKKLPNFLHEIHRLIFDELNDLVEQLYAVTNGMHDELFWVSRISRLHMRKESTSLSYNNVFVTELPTMQLYDMLNMYREKMLEYEKDNIPDRV
jgi:hypothetical protein